MQNTQQNAQVGRQNAQVTVGGLDALAGKYTPANYASNSLSATNQNFDESKTIEQQQQEKAGAIASLIESGASMGLGGVGNLDSTGSSSFGEQIGNFASGAAGV